MTAPSFYGEHLCDVCFGWVHEHDERCDQCEDKDGYALFHVPALCCPGCGCHSYEEAHSEVTADA